MPPLPLSLLEPAVKHAVVSALQPNDRAHMVVLLVLLLVAAAATNNNTCDKARIVEKNVNLLGAVAARRLVEHAVHVSQQQAHVGAHLHRDKRRQAVVVAERVPEDLER
jgi:hypothetical protein